MAERNGVIEVVGISPAAMSNLVAFLYSGAVPKELSETSAGELLKVSDKYEVTRLIKICERELVGKINKTNVISTLILADMHSRACLKNACLEFICLNSADLFTYEEWKCFKQQQKHRSLFREVLEYLNIPFL